MKLIDVEHDPINLLHEALNLCVRGRELDEALLAQEKRRLGSYHLDDMNCLTPHLWMLEKYEKDLASWEEKARAALSKEQPHE